MKCSVKSETETTCLTVISTSGYQSLAHIAMNLLAEKKATDGL